MSAAIRKHSLMHSTEDDLETGEPDPALDMPGERRAVWGSLWMFAISTVFFFIPVVSGFVAGLVGGFRVGATRMALMAAAGALLFTTFTLWMLFTVMPIPVLGPQWSQVQIAILVLLSDLGLFIGAGIGGMIAQNGIDRLNRA